MKNTLVLTGLGVIRVLGVLVSRLLRMQRPSRRDAGKRSARRPTMRNYGSLWRGGIARDVLVVTGLVVVSCGCVRGRRFDELVGHFASTVHEGLIRFLSDGWLHPTLATVTIRGLGLVGCGAAMLGFARLFTSIPSFTSYLALSHLGVVQGRRPCQFDMVVGMSLPISFAMALCSYSSLGLLAAAYFGCAYLYVRTIYDAKAMNRTLEVHARLLSPLHAALRPEDSGDVEMAVEGPAAGPEVEE